VRKTISLFQRNYDGDHLVRNEVVPGAEWVLAGEGVATRKYDGMCCAIIGGKFFKRLEIQAGKIPPPGWAQADSVDTTTGKQQGWILVGEGPEDRWFREALARGKCVTYPFVAGCNSRVDREWPTFDATYELLGPKVQGNPEGFDEHVLLLHEGAQALDAPRDFDGLRAWFDGKDIEGVVWHHPDGRMVKIKTKDFGLRRTRAVVA